MTLKDIKNLKDSKYDTQLQILKNSKNQHLNKIVIKPNMGLNMLGKSFCIMYMESTDNKIVLFERILLNPSYTNLLLY